MSREPFIVKPGRNATLAHAWKALYGTSKKPAQVVKPEPTPAPKKAAKKKGGRK